METPKKPDYAVKQFRASAEFRGWLAKNHAEKDGLWVRFFKKGSGVKTISQSEAIDQALCYGWIDGQAKPLDDKSWVQKFTPRRARSGWSKLNTARARRLIRSGEMTTAGQAEINRAKKDGRWTAAYDSPSSATIPADFLKALGRDKKAKAFFETLNKANLYAIAYRLQTAKKPETRQRRMAVILAMMAAGKKFH